jgi:hemerythrin-like domain-containing protein
MNTAVGKIRSKHRSIAALLQGLQYFLGEIRAGRSVPRFDLLRAMVRYIDAFPERQHPPEGDRHWFVVLRRRIHEADDVLDQLEVQRRRGAEIIRDLQRALLLYEARGSEFFEPFARLADEYARFHWQQMRAEEDVILPLAERVLTPKDWRVFDDTFTGSDDPLLGARARRNYEKLFTRSVTRSPPPIGVGA